MSVIERAAYIKIEAGVRYWDDAYINGNPDEQGNLTPFRNGDLWCPIIRLADGYIDDWPEGMEADFHFKVCDAGTYYLLNADRQVIADRKDNYVPSGLCHGDRGYGDYIIFSVGGNGLIENYIRSIEAEDWEELPF